MAVAPGAAPAAAPVKPPNVVFLLADDFGYAGLKCYGHPYARTPKLDQFAFEGTRFAQFYMTGVTGCPSRTGLMTGKFPVTFRDYPAGAGFGKRATVTELLKRQGYATGHFGTWHIGLTQTRRKRQDAQGRDAQFFGDALRFIEKHKDIPISVNVWGHVSHW